MKHAFRTWFLSVTMLAAVLSLAAATYAWFTSNRAVGTSTATARTGEEMLTLQLSSSGGSAFLRYADGGDHAGEPDVSCESYFRCRRRIW